MIIDPVKKIFEEDGKIAVYVSGYVLNEIADSNLERGGYVYY